MTSLVFSGFGLGSVAKAATLELPARHRVLKPGTSNTWEVVEETLKWSPSHTAMVVCDMWDKHWCPDATERVAEMAPVMNRVLLAARRQGVFIIHCPSDTMAFYKDHPGRKLAQSATKVDTKVPLQGWCRLDGTREPPLPIDDSDGGCDGCPDCPSYRAWTRQHPALEIQEGDAVTDSAEAYYLMRQRGITNVILLGVHENMCVLGRPFSIRQMVAQGQNVVLMRDMTDSMYNHRKRPYVSHFVGTDLVCEHIEKYWCPSITSASFFGGAPFQFQGDRRRTVVVITGENEYDTAVTLPAFLKTELTWRGYRILSVSASPQDKNAEFTNVEAIRDADLLLISVRRRTPSKPMMELLRTHVAAGKPVAGIRTASHAFDAEPTDDRHAAWPRFDDEILGADYQGHYSNKPPQTNQTRVRIKTANATHPVLTGVPTSPFQVTSHLYKYRDMAATATVLLEGRVEGQETTEPVAWINIPASGGRVFYSSLGNPADFDLPAFRRLLLNGILWCLKDPIPPADPGQDQAAAKAPAREAVVSSNMTGPFGVRTIEGRAVEPPLSNPVDLPQETSAVALEPAESLKQFTVAEDLQWDQVLAEPAVSQPVFLNFDERGRMWVVQYRQYPMPAGLKLVSRDSVWRNVYDKVPAPPPRHVQGADKITVHEDTDGDGVFDKHKSFVEGLNIATSVAHGRGGVWILNPPYLLFYPDRNRDDVPDGDPEVRLSGFGLEDTHSVANSLRWGPDGWLYGAQGSTVTAQILVYGPDAKPIHEKPIYSQGQNIWRYHPERRVYEVFCEGGGNAFGCEIDSKGRIFSGHNGGDTRGFHYVQGGYLQKGFEKHGPLSNPYAFGYFPAMAHHRVPRFSHNFVIYEGGAFPASRKGRLFGVEPIQGRLVESEITPEGSTFRTRDLSRPVISGDRWFRPVDIKLGPDGALYVCDWYDRQVNHFRNHEGQMDPGHGRIYRLRARGAKPGEAQDLERLSPAQWVERLGSPNRWQRQTVLRLLADRRDASVLPALLEQLRSKTGQAALESLWALNLCGGFTEAVALDALGHVDPHVRAWTVRLLCDSQAVSSAVAGPLAELAAREPNLEVRNQLAASAKRLPAREGLQVVKALTLHAEDADDNRQPLLMWWAIEAKCESNRDEVLSLFDEPAFWGRPVVERHLVERVMRRFAQSGSRRDLLACARLLERAPGGETGRRLLAGLEQAFQGRSLSALPETLVRAMARQGTGSLTLAARQGDPAAMRRVFETVADETAPREERIQLLGVLGEVNADGAVPVLLSVLRGAAGDAALRQAALRALQRHDGQEIGDAVVVLYPRLDREALASAQTLLSSRAGWSLQFVRAVHAPWLSWSEPLLPKGKVPANMIRKMRQHRDAELQSIIDQVWPGVGVPASAGLEERLQHFSKVMGAGVGDPYHGRSLFQEVCGSCHKLFGQGAEVGPDLTAYQRHDLEVMLLSIVNPNAEVREGYENYQVEMRDGRSLSGILVEQDDHIAVLRGLDGQNQALSRQEILELKPGGLSLMPEGLLDGLEEGAVRDLMAYLRSTQPLVGSAPPR